MVGFFIYFIYFGMIYPSASDTDDDPDFGRDRL